MREDAGVPPERAGAVLSVDLAALQDNWRKLAEMAAPARCAAAVKADGYGICAGKAVEALAAAGCETFFVALPDEGAEVRALAPDAAIYVLCGLLPGTAAFYLEHNLQPVLATPEQVEEWASTSVKRGKPLPAALHIETGINRLGLTASQTRAQAGRTKLLDNITLTLIMSHLASADVPGDIKNAEQKAAFDELSSLFPGIPKSLANSPGTFLGPQYAYDLVRPGIALYGGNPFADRANPMRPVVHLYAPLLQVREIAEGETVGYGATWTAHRPSRIGVLGVGYRDGLSRALSSRGEGGPAGVHVGGHFAPIVGRVSMDLITVDLTDVPDEFAHAGQKVELLGGNISIDEMARWADTIPYEILTGLGTRFARIYSPFDSN